MLGSKWGECITPVEEPAREGPPKWSEISKEHVRVPWTKEPAVTPAGYQSVWGFSALLTFLSPCALTLEGLIICVGRKGHSTHRVNVERADYTSFSDYWLLFLEEAWTEGKGGGLDKTTLFRVWHENGHFNHRLGLVSPQYYHKLYNQVFSFRGRRTNLMEQIYMDDGKQK